MISNYLNFIDVALNISKELPEYSNKYSRKDFNQRQLMTLYLLKQKSKLSYDDFVDDFSTRDSAIERLELIKVPRASTLKMFAKRIKCNPLEILIGLCVTKVDNRKLQTAIDATGFQLEDGSYSYLKRLGISTKKRKNLKLSGCADINKQLFTSVKIRKKNRHDNIDFQILIKKTKKNTKRKIRTNRADKAYDAQKNHDFAEEQGFEHIAPLRSKTKQYHRVKGKHRKKLFKKFPKKKYHRRSIIETMWFCVKRLCGKVIFAKKWIMQKKELLSKVLAYNVNRLAKILK